MIHLGSYASDESNLNRIVDLHDQNKFCVVHKQNKNELVHHRINKNLLELVFQKYVKIYKRTLMSDKQLDRKEIRTEYYNDFDVCLREFYSSSRSHGNITVALSDVTPMQQAPLPPLPLSTATAAASSQATIDDDDNDDDNRDGIKIQHQKYRHRQRKPHQQQQLHSAEEGCCDDDTDGGVSSKRKKHRHKHSQSPKQTRSQTQPRQKSTKETTAWALYGKEEYRRRMSWNEQPAPQRQSQKQHLFKLYKFQGDATPQVYSKAKEDGDKQTESNADDVERMSPTKFEMTVTCPVVDNNNLLNIDSESVWGNEREVILEREGKTSFGISIVGGKVNVGENVVSGIFIKNIIENSPATRCGDLRIGDRILAVDGTDIREATHEVAVNTIKKAGDRLVLLVQSLNKSTFDGDKETTGGFDFIKKPPPPVTPSRTPECEIIQTGVVQKGNSLAPNGNDDNDDAASTRSKTPLVETESEGSSDDEDDNRELEGRTYSKAGVEIDRASAGNVKRPKEEIDADPEQEDQFGYTPNKIKKRYAALGQVLCYSIDRGANTSVGISLAGHRDRNKMACFVAGINPKGAAKQTNLEVGDEILEVNGVVLHGRCHLNASAIIKGLPGPILKMIILRRKAAVEDLAVKPVTQFPVEIDNEDIFASFKNVRTVSIKKQGNQSLGIMIIEGKHAEVGQGIFISDIQEGSNAEKAGLNIGDMILAVNKDSLLGCNYEAAAAMLKKTEGLVTLTVCNPNKAKDDPKIDGDGKSNNSIISNKSDAKGPSRPVTPKPQPSPAKEVVSDPATAEIHANENTTIDISAAMQPLGVLVVGGNDTLVPTGAVIVDILPNSVAAKDNRLKPFDQIMEINGKKITPDLNGEQVQRAVKQITQKFRIIVHRVDPLETESLEIELQRKPNKILGVGFCVGNPHGIVLSTIISGGIVESDGRLQKGDIVTHVNSESISNKSYEECSAILKTVQGRVAIKILRPKPKKRVLG